MTSFSYSLFEIRERPHSRVLKGFLLQRSTMTELLQGREKKNYYQS